MVNIDPKNLYDELKNLQPGESIFVPIPKDVTRHVELIQLQKRSYENLFTAYINNTVDKANEFNLNKFLETYAAKYQEEWDTMRDVIIKNMGTAVFSLINNGGYDYVIDSGISNLVISRRECTDGSCTVVPLTSKEA